MDAPACHRGAVCTQGGNDTFAWFGTTGRKSRMNFLELLREIVDVRHGPMLATPL